MSRVYVQTLSVSFGQLAGVALDFGEVDIGRRPVKMGLPILENLE
jgi:hypothetical protein